LVIRLNHGASTVAGFKVTQIPRAARTILPSTVQEARQQFNEFFLNSHSKRWSALLAARPHVFWLLTFEDLTWLRSQMPPRWETERTTVPAVISANALQASRTWQQVADWAKDCDTPLSVHIIVINLG
jgi:hypothetical protein